MFTRIASTLLAAFTAAGIWTGCDDDEPLPPPPGSLPNVQIVSELPNDTLLFFADDSVYFAVTIIVIGSNGLVSPGQQVNITLSDPALGYIEFADPVLRDTSNSLGRVSCFFHSYALAGEQLITASAGGHADTKFVTMIEAERPVEGFILASNRPHGTVFVSPDSVLTVSLTARFVDAYGDPRTEFDGMFISSSATGGHLERFSVFTNGQATSTWTFLNEYGTFQARIFGNWLDPFTLLPDTTG